MIDTRHGTATDARLEVRRQARAGAHARLIAGGTCRSERALFDALARAFSFPAYAGRNWDAVEECLTDLSWLPAGPRCLVIADADRLLAAAPAERREIAWDVLTAVADAGALHVIAYAGR